MSDKKVTFLVKKVATVPLKISIAIPPEKPTIQGTFIAHALVRTKEENKLLFERVELGELTEDADMIRELFTGFDGIGNENGYCEGEAAFAEILTGANSAYLMPACIQAYYEQYGEAKQGNLRARRGR
jgi:hypothetical protein